MGMSPDLNLSLLACALLGAACLYLSARIREHGFEAALLLPLLLTAGIEAGDLLGRAFAFPPLPIQILTSVCEALLPLAWLYYCSSIGGWSLRRPALPSVFAWGVSALLLAIALVFGGGRLALPTADGVARSLLGPGYLFYLLLAAALVTALISLERLFARLSPRHRWMMKFEVVGLGAIIATQLYYYSHGPLFGHLDLTLLPLRAIALVAGLLLLAFSRLRGERPLRLQLSHAAAFRSVVLLVVSLYLVVLGLAGEGLQLVGAESGRLLLAILALIGGLVVCMLLLSESLRRRTRVFLHKHFFRQKYDYRQLWLEMTEQLGRARSREAIADAALTGYCRTFAVQFGALYLYRGPEEGLILLTAHSNDALPERFDGDGSLVGFLTSRDWVFNFGENRSEIASTAAAGLQRHAVQFMVPLQFGREFIGAIVLGRLVNADEPLCYEDYDLMKVLARQVAASLSNQRLARQLADHREMAAVGKVSAFVMHDLKNLVANLSLVVENGRELIANPQFQADMFATLDNSVSRMKGLIGRLHNVGETPPLSREACNLKQLVRETIAEIGSDNVVLSGEDVDVVVDRAEIGKVVTNLVRNGMEATGGSGGVEVEVVSRAGALLVCRDRGCGMPADFLSGRLFRPFETTKKQGMGVGLYQCRQIVEAHGGRIEVQSVPGRGSEFKVHLPHV